MKEKERVIVSSLVLLMVFLWLGFPFHQSRRFAGSLAGGILAVTGSILMVVPLVYLFVKRIKRLKQKVTKRISMRTLLALHIYSGVLGPILVVIHTGHKFESPLGITLTAMTLLVVVSGFVGRYLMNQISKEIREKKAMLSALQTSYEQAASELAADPARRHAIQPFAGFFSRLVASLFLHESADVRASGQNPLASPHTLLRLSEAISDTEYSIRTHEKFKVWFRKWLKFHILLSAILYLLMALHIWAAIHFGLRWL